MNSRVNVIKEKLDNHANLYESSIQRVTVLKNSNANSNQALSMASAIDNAVHKVKERDCRVTNIVICGLTDKKPKSGSQSDSAEALANDLNLAKDILQKLSKDISSI